VIEDPSNAAGPVEPPLKPLLVQTEQAATMLGVSMSMLRKLDIVEQVPRPVRLGRKVLWSVAELEQWVAAGCPARHRWEASKEPTNAPAEKKRRAPAR
jgi:predicted DNA-binding transcriptional regulator AlpA